MKSISDYGKGATSDQLIPLFLNFYKIIRKNPNATSDPLASCMYIQNFGKDKMSDLITNIIRKLLHDFTIKQCIFWNIPLTTDIVSLGYYWDPTELVWKELRDRSLKIDNKYFLLVPKEVARTNYVFNIECYIKQYILRDMQEDYRANKPDMCRKKEYKDGRYDLVPPPRKELYKKEVYGCIHKEYAFKSSIQSKTAESRFVNDIMTRIRLGYGSLSDDVLNKIVYKPTEFIA